jgi:hypothetical protein
LIRYISGITRHPRGVIETFGFKQSFDLDGLARTGALIQARGEVFLKSSIAPAA